MTLDVSGAGGRVTATVVAQVTGTAGGLDLRLELPDGVTLDGSSGEWTSCRQSGQSVRCSGGKSAGPTWTGTIATVWPSGVSGRIAAAVSGTYANGAPAQGSSSVSWPP